MPVATANALDFSRRALTAILTKPLPPPGGRAYYRDARAAGLTLLVLPSGIATLQLVLRVRGRPTRISLGRFDASLPDARQLPPGVDALTFIASRPALSVRMARDLAALVRAALAQGISPVAHRRALHAEPSVGDVLDDYLAHIVARKRPESIESVKMTIPRLKPLRSTLITALTAADVRKLHTSLGQQGIKTMANRSMDTLRAAIYLGMKGGAFALPKGNPVSGLERFPEVQRERFLSVAELGLLRKALTNEPDEQTRAIVELLILTGARKTALRTARWEDIDLARAEWRVPGEASKSGKPYTVPLLPPAVAILKALKAKPIAGAAPGRVFSLSDSSLTRAWARQLATAKRLAPAKGNALAGVRLHDLRRTFGSHAAMAGVSLHIVGKLLGHESLRATGVYARLSGDALRDAVGRASATLLPPPGVGSVQQITEAKRRRKHAA